MALAIVLGGLLALVGVLGLLDAAYFVGVTYRWISPEAPWIPRVCRMDEETCARIVDTSFGRALGLPNAVFGLAWYAIVTAGGLALALGSTPHACGPALIASALVVLFSVYLVWSLVQKLDVFCPLCYVAHGLNFLVLVLVVLACSTA